MEERAKGGGIIELTGNRRAVIDGCGGVIDYDAEQVLLRCGPLRVRIAGKRLRILRLTDHSAVVEGVLSAVELGSGEGERHAG